MIDNWVKCSDKQPTESGWYHVFQGDNIFSRKFSKGCWLHEKEDKYGKITHWQPLLGKPTTGE